jgi:hypothetical protein
MAAELGWKVQDGFSYFAGILELAIGVLWFFFL